MGYAANIGTIYGLQVTSEQMQIKGQGELKQPMELIQRAWYNPGLRSQNVLIPGIIALVMIVVAALLTSTTVAKEWEMGTMEQLISTPLRGPELIFGKILPCIYLKGIGLEILWLNALFLALYALLMIILANRNFSFKLE